MDRMIVVEGVSFSVELCKRMTEEDFIEKHTIFFTDRTLAKRKKLLADIYKRINLDTKEVVKEE